MSYIGSKPTNVPLGTSDLADSIITSAKISDGTIATADIADGAVTLAKTTNVGGTNTPAFSVTKSADQSIPNTTETKITWNTEVFDTDTAFASDKFVVPSTGKYIIYVSTRLESGTAANLELKLYKNGSEYLRRLVRSFSSEGINLTDIGTFNTSDYLEVYFWHDEGSATNIAGGSGDVTRSVFQGFKLTE